MSNPGITYTRTFQHTDWVDNVDRVQAGGSNGFNLRFHEVEGEFDSLSSVITLIRTALDALGQAPAPTPTVLSLTPAFVPTAAIPWNHTSGRAEKTAGQTAAHGMMSVNLPNGATLQNLRAAGRNSGGGNLRITLFRQGVTPDATAADLIARVDQTSDPYDVTVAAAAANHTVDTTKYKYFVTADLDNALAADTVMITGIQINYLAVH